ncbi:unnamed protein product [Arabis nemorensis]|uniref:Uncharacterized protein n=1 Tax=Arabis nemorensis TaxID=586526 RepID=A0A565BDC8_9BRAS|nr:unnamed protein product [Arabis nemorensis]
MNMNVFAYAVIEETWRALFSGIRYAKNFSKPVCFRHAILSPLGYETAIFKGVTGEFDCKGEPAHNLWQNPDNKKTARLSEFGEMIRSAFEFPVNQHRSLENVQSWLINEEEKDQVRTIQDSSVIIGAHGAGLAHIVAATPNTTIFEIVSVDFKRPHFKLIAKWKGLEYHAMDLADPTAVIEKLKEIMKSLGC